MLLIVPQWDLETLPGDHLGQLDVAGRIILQRILQK
jgi:hypothetical protein